jgi:hypothetical protein
MRNADKLFGSFSACIDQKTSLARGWIWRLHIAS